MHPIEVFNSVFSPLFTFFIIETVLPYSNITAISEPNKKTGNKISPPLTHQHKTDILKPPSIINMGSLASTYFTTTKQLIDRLYHLTPKITSDYVFFNHIFYKI